MAPMRSRSSRRSTIMSSAPCSSRNSLRWNPSGRVSRGFVGDSYTVANAVFANNTSSGTGASGGGIELRGGSLSMTNCTITNNAANANVGGGIAITNGTGNRGNVSLNNTVVTGEHRNRQWVFSGPGRRCFH